MIKISSKSILILSPILVFLSASFIWYLILYQIISFLSGFTILIFLIFFVFWQNFMGLRRSGELFGLKSRKQIIIISAILVLGLSELIWSISFLPFSFFILGGILAVIFGITLDIYKEYFRESSNVSLESEFAARKKIKKIFIRDIITGIILIILFIFISPWFPPKTY